MRWIRRFATLIGLLLVLAAALGLWYARQTIPQTEGQLQVSGLAAPVQVNRDGSDVTHILAQGPRDAWMALGYVHAQERGWQLAFNRAVMRGTLSEFLGPATLETDKLMRTLGIRQVAQRQLATLPPDAKAAV
jgi:penicillin G amidase